MFACAVPGVNWFVTGGTLFVLRSCPEEAAGEEALQGEQVVRTNEVE
jgi:hypothetical protein